jgi:hypothetical protein
MRMMRPCWERSTICQVYLDFHAMFFSYSSLPKRAQEAQERLLSMAFLKSHRSYRNAFSEYITGLK